MYILTFLKYASSNNLINLFAIFLSYLLIFLVSLITIALKFLHIARKSESPIVLYINSLKLYTHTLLHVLGTINLRPGIGYTIFYVQYGFDWPVNAEITFFREV